MNKKNFLIMALWFVFVAAAGASELEKNFIAPPLEARPWVYWFWLNSNITKQGISADLEAMKRAGIGGVLIMEVDQGAPVGPVAFMGAPWRELFKHAAAEAQRLGLEVNMNDDAGWNGSGGPWIKPEESMQKIVWSEVDLKGPRHFDSRLQQPETVAGFYQDIAVLAVPTPGAFRIENIKAKAGFERGDIVPAKENRLAPALLIARDRIVDLTARLKPDGRLNWNIPAGPWTILRFGHTSTGAQCAPAPASGRGLECDKLSTEGIEAQFAGMMAKLIADVGPAAGKSLVATHVDSWENGAQNWTARMREEFCRRRGYDPLLFLPALTGRVVDSLSVSERFLWDWRQTISDLLVENYAGHLKKLAQQHGLRLTIEAYGGPCDDMTYAGRADEPMAEFWIGGGAFETCKEMSSAAHTYGKRIIGAESFTADDSERWQEHPATIKALGDRALCAGINRFVFHRYALQPWLNYRPGMTMGPWGLHYERTQTWWELTSGWHEYLARCQSLLRQGLFVADICYLQPEAAPQGFLSHPCQGYDFDNCTAEAVLTRMSVKDGRILLPDGMSYRLLVLPPATAMTPPLLRKIKELAEAGATVIGPRPTQSPSLTDFPHCDEEVQRLGEELWGKNKVLANQPPEKLLAALGVPPDVRAPAPIRWIHRRSGDTEIYFIARSLPGCEPTTCTFRVSGRVPELWWPDTGRIETAPVYREQEGCTRVLLPLGPNGSVFVVFRHRAEKSDPVVALTVDRRPLLSLSEALPPIVVRKAVYGVLEDPPRTRDVRAKVQELVDRGDLSFKVGRLAAGDDPAFGTLKRVAVEYTIADKPFTASGTDADTITIAPPGTPPPLVELHRGAGDRLVLEAQQSGRFELKTASGRTRQVRVSALPPPLPIDGPWLVSFPPDLGAPQTISFAKLISWSENPETGVKYFSGTATYAKKIRIPAKMLAKNRRLYLDLGAVAVMARVQLNGKDLGVLWKPPFTLDVTAAARPGENTLEVKVTNLWINRMLGDEQLPEDSERNSDGTLKSWPPWVQAGQPSPTGRITFTSWRLWKKGEHLQPSGLLGPVTLRAAERMNIQE